MNKFNATQSTTETNQASFQLPQQCCPHLTDADITGDIERVIANIVRPYVDDSNPLLHFDEMQAECRAKFAVLLHNGVLARCRTRAKVFAFIKTALKNHIRSLVQKHSCTEKRGGVKPRLSRSHPAGRSRFEGWTKTPMVRLDDEETVMQVGRADDAMQLRELVEQVHASLSTRERRLLDLLTVPTHTVEPMDANSAADETILLDGEGVALAEIEAMQSKVRSICQAAVRIV